MAKILIFVGVVLARATEKQQDNGIAHRIKIETISKNIRKDRCIMRTPVSESSLQAMRIFLRKTACRKRNERG
jgi:hypothetical protein